MIINLTGRPIRAALIVVMPAKGYLLPSAASTDKLLGLACRPIVGLYVESCMTVVV